MSAKIKEMFECFCSSLLLIKNFFWILKSMQHYNSYSQCGEDAVLRHLLSVLSVDIRCPGFYVDVGAFHPSLYSNTNFLYNVGWKGINIDPNPHSIALFESARPRDINLNFGVGNTCGLEKLHMFSDGAVNTFSDAMAQGFKDSGFHYLGSRLIEMRTLNSILDQYLPPKQSIDILDIDCEGLDEEILWSFDIQRFCPKILLVEAHGFDFSKPLQHPVFRYMVGQGYKVEAKVGPTLIASHN